MAIDVEHYYEKYGPMVLRRCRRLLMDEALAVDAMQDTFVQLIRFRDRMDGAAPSSLLYRIATNVCRNRLRSQRRSPDTCGDESLAHIEGSINPEAVVEARNFLERLFSTEKASTRTIVRLYMVEGWPLTEVSHVVGLSVSGVRKRLRAFQRRVTEEVAAPTNENKRCMACFSE